MNVIYLPEVIEYIDELTYTLYKKDYFGFLDTAKDYTDKLTTDIENSIHTKLKKVSPARFKQYGSHYVTYHSTRRTTWYIFFFYKKDRYIIGYITNNHVSAQHIRGLK